MQAVRHEQHASLHILVVEPNQVLQRLVHAWLVSNNFKDTLVSDVEHAISACAQYRYDLIFMELDPAANASSDGFSVSETIRGQGLNKDTAIVGWASSDRQNERATASGINEVIVKPFNKANIEEMVATWGGLRVEPLPQLNLDEPLFDLTQLAAPDFLTQPMPQPKTARVLVVEDCSLTQHVITSLLKELTANVEQAFDGAQAILSCNTTTFDVIFMDIHMPKVNGLEATHHIRSTSNRNAITPIIAFTSTGRLEDYTMFGVNDLLKKPFTTDSLSAIFDKWTPYTKELNHPNPGAAVATGPPKSPPIPGNGMQVTQGYGSAGGFAMPQQNPQPYMLPAPTAAQMQQFQSTQGTQGKATKTNVPVAAHAGGAGGPWPKMKGKKQNALGHTAKEKMRRASIVNSCNSFRTLVPMESIRDADKATVFRISVEYLAYLRVKIPKEDLAALDVKFAQQQEDRYSDQSAAQLDLTAQVPAEAVVPASSRGGAGGGQLQ